MHYWFVRSMLAASFFGIYFFSFCQGNPVQWSDHVIHQEDTYSLRLQAQLAPGWHLYSQYLEEGGPIPTRFTFESSVDFSFIGEFEEIGKSVGHYDSLYGINIVYYSDSVIFSRSFIPARPTIQFVGTVTYLVCNLAVCVPGNQSFLIESDLRHLDHR
jgi:hypothetical protein